MSTLKLVKSGGTGVISTMSSIQRISSILTKFETKVKKNKAKMSNLEP
jgi:hypothetical protein